MYCRPVYFRPYKLTPATELALNKLKVMTVTEQLVRELNLQECSICQEELDVGSRIAEIPGCGHCFHNECVLKWFALVWLTLLGLYFNCLGLISCISCLLTLQQSWCPVCRTKILPDDNCCGGTEEEEDEHNHNVAVTKGVSSDSIMDVKSNLGARFSDAAEDRMEEVDWACDVYVYGIRDVACVLELGLILFCNWRREILDISHVHRILCSINS